MMLDNRNEDKLANEYLNSEYFDALDSDSRLSYLQCKSAQKQYIPNYEMNDKSFYKEVIKIQAFATRDLRNYMRIKDNVILSYEQDSFLTPKIYCSFHFGSFKIINCILYEKDIDFVVVANASIISDIGMSMKHLNEEENARTNKKNTFEFIDAQSNSAIIQMIRTLRDGKSLVIYTDGANGLGGFARNDEKVLKINFSNVKIFARTGVAFLSHFLNIPIVPVLSWRGKDFEKIYIKFYRSISPFGEREYYITDTTQRLWKILENKFLKYPSQWEAMLYSGHFISSENKGIEEVFCADKYYLFNTDQFDFFKMGNSYYLYNSKEMSYIKLSNLLFKVLATFKDQQIVQQGSFFIDFIKKTLLEDLVRQKVLVPIDDIFVT